MLLQAADLNTTYHSLVLLGFALLDPPELLLLPLDPLRLRAPKPGQIHAVKKYPKLQVSHWPE